IRAPHVHGAGKVLRRVDLDIVDAVQLRFAHRGASEPRAVDVLVLGEALVEARRRVRIVVGGARVDRLADDLHAWTLDVARFDRIAQVDGVEAAARIHVETGGESGREIDLRIGQRTQRALRQRAPAGVHVHVRVDHAGQHGRGTEVDDGHPGRDLDGRGDLR